MEHCIGTLEHWKEPWPYLRVPHVVLRDDDTDGGSSCQPPAPAEEHDIIMTMKRMMMIVGMMTMIRMMMMMLPDKDELGENVVRQQSHVVGEVEV